MTEQQADDPVGGMRYLTFREALRSFVPHELWDEYERALSGVAAEPRRPSYRSMGAREWSDAMEIYRGQSDLRARARANTETAMERIVDHLIERLLADELTGVVQDQPPFGPWRAIPSLSWRSLEPVDTEAGHFRAGKTELRSVQVVEGRYEPPIEIVSSGAPGRPTSRQIYMAEFKRRCEAGIAGAAVKAEAAYLESWMAQRHPAAPGAEAKTIENNIREDHRAWRSHVAGSTGAKVKKLPEPTGPPSVVMP